MKVTELLEAKTDGTEFSKILRDFLPLAMEQLDIQTLPHFKIVPIVPEDEQPTFGKFVHEENIIYIGIEERHPLDVIRTLAHELVHYRQGLKKELGPNSGETGSPSENEAHELAGIIMRHFNKKHPQYFQDTAIHIGEDVDINYGIGTMPGKLFTIGDVGPSGGKKKKLNLKVPHAKLHVGTKDKKLGLPKNTP